MEYWKNLDLKDIDGEIWKNVVGYENIYEISNLGRLKCLKRSFNRKNQYKDYVRYFDEVIIKQRITHKGYLTGHLYKTYEKQKYVFIHRLVAFAFIPNPNNYPQINHIDCNKLNNRPENLEWCNNSMNQIHAIKHGLKIVPKGENNYKAKLTNKQASEIRCLYQPRIFSIRKLAKIYNVTYNAIRQIIHNKTYINV